MKYYKTIGYGMSINEFNTLQNSNENIYKQLEKLSLARPNELIIPNEDLYKAPIIYDRYLLSYRINNISVYGNPCELFTVVTDINNNPTNIVFYPSLHFKKDWYHCNSKIDYIEELYINNKSNTDLKFNIDIIINSFLTEYLPKGISEFSERYINNIPEVPFEIKWYLTKFNIFNKNDVNKLKPIYAKWWN